VATALRKAVRGKGGLFAAEMDALRSAIAAADSLGTGDVTEPQLTAQMRQRGLGLPRKFTKRLFEAPGAGWRGREGVMSFDKLIVGVLEA
jgi:hypothetical protein